MTKKKMPEFDRAEYEKLIRDLPKLPAQVQEPQLSGDDAGFNLWNTAGRKMTGKYKLSASLPKELP